MDAAPPVPPPPFYPRVRLPDISQPRGGQRANADDEPIFRAAAKMQERKRELEAELRKGCDLPHQFREAPLFGRPPPVPKPQGLHLPPINGGGGASPQPAPQRPDSWRKPWQQPSEASDNVPSPPPPAAAYPDKPREARPRVSLRGAHEAREQERRADRQREEARRQREAENVRQRQAEEEWENDIRKRFKQEKVQMDAQRQWRHSEADSERLRAEAEARMAEANARRAEAAAAEAKRKAERFKRQMEQEAGPEKFSSPSAEQKEAEEQKASEQQARHRRHAKRQSHGEAPRSTPRAAAYMRRDLNKSSTLTGSRKVILQKEEQLKLAEEAAMKQLNDLRQLATKKERQKGFKELLRAWHPDKNPENLEVATAVFQRLQAERGRVLNA